MKEMGSKMGELTEELRSKRVTGASGGGMVEVEMNGANEVIDIRIDDVVMADKEMLLDLTPVSDQSSNRKGQRNFTWSR